MPEALRRAHHIGQEFLPRRVAGDAAADYVAGAAAAFQPHGEAGDRLFVLRREQLFFDFEARSRAHDGVRRPFGEGDSAELDGLYLEHGILAEEAAGHGVEHLSRGFAALGVVPFDIPHMRAAFEAEGVDAVVFGFAGAGAVYAAARDYGDIRAFAYVEVVVDGVVQSRLGEQHGDMRALAFDARADIDVDAFLVRLGDDLDVGVRGGGEAFAVFPYVEAALGDGVQSGYLC